MKNERTQITILGPGNRRPAQRVDEVGQTSGRTNMLAALLGRLKPSRAASAEVVRSGETLAGFVWRASGKHQFYAGLIAIAVALLTFAPIDLQRRIVDEAIENGDVRTLLILGGLYLAIIAIQGLLKYALQLYQGWVGESAVKGARDQLAAIAAKRPSRDEATSGQTVNVIGREIDNVGGFVGTSISEFVVNSTILISIAGYMLYIQPVIALVSAVFLLPQVLLARYMQADLNLLVERQVGLVRRLGDETMARSKSKGIKRKSRTIPAIFRNRMKFYFLKYGLKTLLSAANAMGPLVVLIVGGYLVIQGQTTIGIVVAFVSGFERISSPLHDLLNFYREYQQAKVQLQMIVDWAEGGGKSRA